MFNSSMSQLLSSVLVAVIAALASIVVAYIQTKRKEPSTSPSIALPKSVSFRRQRQPMLWIIIFTLLGGVLGYIIGAVFKDTEIATETTTTSISDDFSIRSPRWPIGEHSSESLISRKYITNGIYHWETAAFTVTAATIEPAIPIFTDFDLSVDMKQVKGPSDIAYGVLFRGNIQDGWYNFVIRNDGGFDLLFIPSSGGVTQLIPWSNTTAIGVDRNNLRVVARGNKLRLYVNGTLVGEIITDESRYGKVGLYVGLREGDDVAFEIDNFQIIPLDE